MTSPDTPSSREEALFTRAPRLFVETALELDGDIPLKPPQAHYLRHVMRLADGDLVRLFNGTHGEWLGRLNGGRRTSAVTLKQIRPQKATVGPWLLYAPLKKDATDFVVQKAVELGCSRLQPTITSRTQARFTRLDRSLAQAIEAAEQCERLDLPDLDPARPLADLVATWPADRTVFVAVERSDTPRAPLEAMAAHKDRSAAFLVGPEGGFSAGDLDALAPLSPVHLGLGPRILRAETAAIAVLALWQACAGDWRDPSP